MDSVKFKCSLHPGELLTSDWCEENCERYYHCDTVAWADDEQKRVDREFPFGGCAGCGKEFNSELRDEYGITHCPWCGTKIDDCFSHGNASLGQ